MQLLAESGGVIYDLTGSVTELSWTDPLNDGAGYLEFSYVRGTLLLENGSPVRLTGSSEADGIFFGTVFKVSTSESGIVKAKAYDRLRYCKTKDTIVLENDTLVTLVQKMCAFFSFVPGVLTESGYPLAAALHTDKTWLDIIYTAISDTLMGTGHYYCLRDEYGSICLRDIADLQLPLVIGSSSLAYGYDYEKSIDEEFYNQVKLVSENESSGKGDVYMVYDSDSIGKYGLLQYYEKLDANADSAKAKEKADALLRLYNHETEKLSFSCVGSLQVRAGTSIYGSIDDISLNRRLIVSRVVHKFLPVHVMTLEVMMG